MPSPYRSGPRPLAPRRPGPRRPPSFRLPLAALLAALCGLAAARCALPDQADAARFGTLRVAFGPSVSDPALDWRADQLAELEPGVRLLAHLGPAVQVVGEGDADVVVRPFDSGPGCTRGVGRYTPGARFVEVDPACAGGYLALERSVNHEVAHFFTYTRWGWAGHICAHVADRGDCSSVVASPDALLSPSLVGGDALGPSTSEAYVPAVDEPAPADADLRQVDLCERAGRCP